MLYKLELDMPPIAKRRPRATIRNGHVQTYHDNDYSDWLNQAKCSFIEQWKDKEPLAKVGECHIKMYGTHDRSDIDNLSGSVLDALVKAGVLKNDNTKVLADLHTVFKKVKENPRIEIWLETTNFNEVYTQWTQPKSGKQVRGATIE